LGEIEADQLLRFIEIEPFTRLWKKHGLGDDDLLGLQYQIMLAPESGDVVPGTNGVRKFRFAPPGVGKCGAFRVVYSYFPAHGTVLPWSVLGKGDRDNWNRAELNALAAMNARAQQVLDREKEDDARRA